MNRYPTRIPSARRVCTPGKRLSSSIKSGRYFQIQSASPDAMAANSAAESATCRTVIRRIAGRPFGPSK